MRTAAFLPCTVPIQIFQNFMRQNGDTEEPQVSGGTVHVTESLSAWRTPPFSSVFLVYRSNRKVCCGVTKLCREMDRLHCCI